MSNKENILLTTTHCLIFVKEQITTLNLSKDINAECENIKNNFCGNVFHDIKSFNDVNPSPNTIIYLCGDIKNNYEKVKNTRCDHINVIKELSYNYENDSENYELIDIGQVPINIHNVGVYFKKLFNTNKDYFNLIKTSHQFQALTESNKPNDAFRSGIYLTKVKEESENELKFRLLRCSSNLHGPTDNFRAVDNEIINTVNEVAENIFQEKADLNHVLAQIYENKIVNVNNKDVEKKAKIKAHSDKTKDMPENGLIAFCTFYDFNNNNDIKKSKDDLYGYNYKNGCVLTKLRFRLKGMVTDTTLTKNFDITLYPNSVFIIPLSTNRLYTHEIIPSGLPIDKIPTRLGYVIRCSNMEAIFKDNQTYINENGNHIKLEEPNNNGRKELKDLYFDENTTDKNIHYNKFYFSLNKGDYEKPIL